MNEPGERRPAQATSPSEPPRRRTESWSASRAVLMAMGAGLLAAIAWAVLRSVFDVTIGSLVVAALGGWGIGASLRRGELGAPLAGVLAFAAWGLGLMLAWLVAMAILPGSSRSLVDRVAATPFLDWLSPQLGLAEVGALVVFGGAALLAVRPGRVGAA